MMAKEREPACEVDFAALPNKGYTTMKEASLWRTSKSIAWAFFGVRRGADYQEDVKNLNIFHIIFFGIFACFAFVLALMFLAKWAAA